MKEEQKFFVRNFQEKLFWKIFEKTSLNLLTNEKGCVIMRLN